MDSDCLGDESSSYSFSSTDSDLSSSMSDIYIEHPLKTSISDIMNHKRRFHTSFKELEHFSKTLNKQHSKVKVPTKATNLKSQCEKRYKYETFVFCDTCGDPCRLGFCSKCDKETLKRDNNYIIYIPLKQQILATLKKYSREIIEYLSSPTQNDFVTDINDAAIMTEMKKEFVGSEILSFTINVDGAQLFKNTNKSLWPVQLYQNYLPPLLRYQLENIIVSTLSIGKPEDMTQLLFLLAIEVNNLSTQKIPFFDGNSLHKFIPLVLYCSCDLPARAAMMGMQTFCGIQSCPQCMHPGVSVFDRRGNPYIRYIRLSQSPQPRTEQKVLQFSKNLNIDVNIKNIQGQKRIPPMLLFPHFDLVKGFTTDYIHAAILGTMKRLFDIWMGSIRSLRVGKNSYMNFNARKTLNQRIIAIKPISEMKRKPRSIFERSTWVAEEYRYMLLFYLPYALQNLIDVKLLHHFRKFSYAMQILLKSRITHDEINIAGKMLNEFADDFEVLYGKDLVTMNLHLLRHLSSVVRDSGPLWSYSVFGFERNMGRLKASKNGTIYSLEQIAFRYCLKMNEPDELYHTELQFSGIKPIAERFVYDLLKNFNITEPIFYSNIRFGGTLFNSSCSPKTKSMDNFLQIEDGIFSSYIFLKNGADAFVVTEKYNVIKRIGHFFEIHTSGRYEIQSFANVSKLLYMRFDGVEVVTKPNSYNCMIIYCNLFYPFH